MQEDFRLIVDLVSVLAAAAMGGVFASLLRQPAILGYLLGGTIVGPAGLGLIKELIQVETLAQFGVAFLLFALGVEFSLTKLKKVQWIALGGGAAQIILTILGTTAIALAIGWVNSAPQGIFLGGILSLSSTAVVLKCLMESNETETPHAQVMLGILVVQDLALGLMLAVLPALDREPEAIASAVGFALLQLLLFAIGAIALGIWVIPPVLRLLARTESRELFLLGVVTICLGIALLTEHLGLSIEMGAFVAGLTISEVEYADQTLTYVEPLRDIFAALFFAAVGMLIDPLFLWDNLELILGLVILVLVGKFAIVTPIVRAFGYPLKTALMVGAGLAQIGEFSFVLASAGQTLGLVSRRVYLLIVGTTALTLIVTPFLLRWVPQLLNWAENTAGWEILNLPELPKEVSIEGSLSNHVVVCGYGQMGRNLIQLLQSHHYSVVAIDQSEGAIRAAADAGLPYVYGNAASLHVLEKAGVSHCRGLAIALPDPMSTRLCLKRALELSPDLDIVALASQDRDIELLYQLGAREVVQPKFEASLELATHLLTGMGFPLPVLQRQVQQIRNRHYLDLRPETSAEQVSRDLRRATQEMNSRWYPIPQHSPLIGLTLEETDFRRLTGVSLMAIRRAGGLELDYPEPQTSIEQGDRLLVVGESEELVAFEQLTKGEATVPPASQSCQWIKIPPQSHVVGQQLWQLHIRRDYGIEIQAIRRDGKFIRFPGGGADLQAGDLVLLCGNYQNIHKVRQILAATEVLLPLAVPSSIENNFDGMVILTEDGKK
ncbi:cation:proton antiporter [Kamptonema cortianum]|nr:cation:proton antiporter [Desertifilum sp.]MDK3159320.1 cation:proton antiporter [Kamptonema cortianum]